jgi:phosphomannomutase/phosphoglucomutase
MRTSNTTLKLITRFEANTQENAKMHLNVLIKLFEEIKGK